MHDNVQPSRQVSDVGRHRVAELRYFVQVPKIERQNVKIKIVNMKI
jgi:hypothetical protein